MCQHQIQQCGNEDLLQYLRFFRSLIEIVVVLLVSHSTSFFFSSGSVFFLFDGGVKFVLKIILFSKLVGDFVLYSSKSSSSDTKIWPLSSSISFLYVTIDNVGIIYVTWSKNKISMGVGKSILSISSSVKIMLVHTHTKKHKNVE